MIMNTSNALHAIPYSSIPCSRRALQLLSAMQIKVTINKVQLVGLYPARPTNFIGYAEKIYHF